MISRDRIPPGRKREWGEMCSEMPLVEECGEMWGEMGEWMPPWQLKPAVPSVPDVPSVLLRSRLSRSKYLGGSLIPFEKKTENLSACLRFPALTFLMPLSTALRFPEVP